MISRELLSEIIGDGEVYITKEIVRNEYRYKNLNWCYAEDTYESINIHELAHKCKEWAVSNNYGILSGFDWNKNPKADVAEINSLDDSIEFIADTELEAIFKACEWINE